MRIVAVSDTHGQHRALRLPPGDVLVHAGDFTARNSWLELPGFYAWMMEQDFRRRVLVAGNHDWIFDLRRPEALALKPKGIDYLEDRGVEIEGVKFWGSPVQPAFMGWAFNRERGEAIRRHWDLIPDGVDVLVTHGPPMGILDSVSPGGERLGCRDLAEAVARVRPRLHIFGHIHGGGGERSENGTRFVNAAQVDESYRLAYGPYVADV